MKRRIFLKGGMAAGVAVGAGLLVPRAVPAAYPKAQFSAKSVDDALGGRFEHSDDIKIKAPDSAENGAAVPVWVTTGIAGVSSISILAAKNGAPMTSKFVLGEGALGSVSTRIKMRESADIIAVVEADGKMYANKKTVKVANIVC